MSCAPRKKTGILMQHGFESNNKGIREERQLVFIKSINRIRADLQKDAANSMWYRDGAVWEEIQDLGGNPGCPAQQSQPQQRGVADTSNQAQGNDIKHDAF
eukprot:CAMPEP_0179088606 /NCGR_PEP_ID=MMETSP0796-20121207/40325_1 /TAXON_ID=73915 /ORGANISM="Pyrodinium bahamense, Strain pbaha01" /LENGTH=100 /DNA_ID=CAMNT_0020786139 /DNA_START=772 /DNA_END=1072 /DNA_ORIENTATION=+